MDDILKVGDKIRFSTELLQDIHKQPKHQSRAVIIERIEEDEDCKVIWVKNAE